MKTITQAIIEKASRRTNKNSTRVSVSSRDKDTFSVKINLRNKVVSKEVSYSDMSKAYGRSLALKNHE